jgi:hypothetical protein
MITFAYHSFSAIGPAPLLAYVAMSARTAGKLK